MFSVGQSIGSLIGLDCLLGPKTHGNLSWPNNSIYLKVNPFSKKSTYPLNVKARLFIVFYPRQDIWLP
jgi:hypothetical protein